jgi:hypothetical protein
MKSRLRQTDRKAPDGRFEGSAGAMANDQQERTGGARLR